MSQLERLRALGIAYIAFATARPAVFLLMFGPELEKDAFPALRWRAAKLQNFARPLQPQVAIISVKGGGIKSGDPMFQKPYQPIVTDRVEERADVGIEHPVDPSLPVI